MGIISTDPPVEEIAIKIVIFVFVGQLPWLPTCAHVSIPGKSTLALASVILRCRSVHVVAYSILVTRILQAWIYTRAFKQKERFKGIKITNVIPSIVYQLHIRPTTDDQQTS